MGKKRLNLVESADAEPVSVNDFYGICSGNKISNADADQIVSYHTLLGPFSYQVVLCIVYECMDHIGLQ